MSDCGGEGKRKGEKMGTLRQAGGFRGREGDLRAGRCPSQWPYGKVPIEH